MSDALYMALMAEIERHGSRCAGDDRFIDDDTPAAELAPICDRCPAREACEAFAAAEKPLGGIWAGRRWATEKRLKPAPPRKRPLADPAESDEPRVCWRCGIQFAGYRHTHPDAPCFECRRFVTAPPGGWTLTARTRKEAHA